jgi:hypothetical protein
MIIKSLPGKHGGVIITLSGPIMAGDADTFNNEIQQANAAGKSVENVQLNSVGGRLIEGIKLAARRDRRSCLSHLRRAPERATSDRV